MIPFASIRKLAGMAFTAYCLAGAQSQYFRSETCVQVSLSSWIAFSQSSLLRSSDTPNTSNPFLLYSAHTLTTLGFSWRQGPHHAAQKSSSNSLVSPPILELSEIGLPSGSLRVKSGAFCPTATALSC